MTVTAPATAAIGASGTIGLSFSGLSAGDPLPRLRRLRRNGGHAEPDDRPGRHAVANRSGVCRAPRTRTEPRPHRGRGSFVRGCGARQARARPVRPGVGRRQAVGTRTRLRTGRLNSIPAARAAERSTVRAIASRYAACVSGSGGTDSSVRRMSQSRRYWRTTCDRDPANPYAAISTPWASSRSGSRESRRVAAWRAPAMSPAREARLRDHGRGRPRRGPRAARDPPRSTRGRDLRRGPRDRSPGHARRSPDRRRPSPRTLRHPARSVSRGGRRASPSRPRGRCPDRRRPWPAHCGGARGPGAATRRTDRRSPARGRRRSRRGGGVVGAGRAAPRGPARGDRRGGRGGRWPRPRGDRGGGPRTCGVVVPGASISSPMRRPDARPIPPGAGRPSRRSVEVPPGPRPSPRLPPDTPLACPIGHAPPRKRVRGGMFVAQRDAAVSIGATAKVSAS